MSLTTEAGVAASLLGVARGQEKEQSGGERHPPRGGRGEANGVRGRNP